MTRYLLMLILFGSSFCALASEKYSMTLINTEYHWLEETPAPSCGLMRARAKQRRKVIREFKHHTQGLSEEYDIFFQDSYLLNRLFLDPTVWQNETIQIVHTWQIDEAVRAELLENKNDRFFELISDGIDWVAQPDMFPEEVTFDFEVEKDKITTSHDTYYVDYCEPRKIPELNWYRDPALDLSTTTEQAENFVKQIKGE